MTKLAHAKAEETDIKQTAELDFEMENAYLKKKREEEENKETEERLKRIANLEASVSNLQQQQQ